MDDILLRNARLIDGTGKVWERTEVLVGDGRIQSISSPTPGGAQANSLDLAGRTVIPGLINCHTHICGASLDVVPGVSPTQLAARYAVRGAGWLRDALARGVTAIRDVGGIHHVDLALKHMVEDGTIPGPSLSVSGHLICMTGGHGHAHGIEADGPDAVRRAARSQLKAGVDVIKVMATGGIMTPGTQPGAPQLTREEMAAAVDEAHKAGRTAAAHAEGREGIRNAILAGIDSIEHGYELDDEIIELMLERGTYLCPTLTCDIRIAEHGDELGLPADSVEKMNRWIDHLLASFGRAQAAGVRIAAGNDAFADWVTVGDMGSELAAMVQHGMSPHGAIIAATANAAALLGRTDEGTLAPRKRANLVVLEGDPLAHIEAVNDVAAVMKDGEWFANRLVG